MAANGGRLATCVIWGSTTDVGKTLVSCALSCAAKRLGVPFCYVKPVQTGVGASEWEFDGARVARAAGVRHGIGDHAAVAAAGISSVVARQDPASIDRVGTLFGWRAAVSPHLAVELEGRIVSDGEIVAAIRSEHESFLGSLRSAGRDGLLLVEIAGGPLSPGPSGTPLADILRPLRFPGLLVGSARLGGITGTLAAMESIQCRGYDLSHVVLLEGEGEGTYRNAEKLAELTAADGVAVRALDPLCPTTTVEDGEAFVSELEGWLSLRSTMDASDCLVSELMESQFSRMRELAKAPAEALQTFWYPFVQHKGLGEDQVSVIDSKDGHGFWALDRQGGSLVRKFDGSASWWTQGPDLTMQVEMAKRLSYAAARYGHVLFPNNVHEPVLGCTRGLLSGPGSGWARRVFYSDNGSTAVEVALKMAFRTHLISKHGEGCLGEGLDFDPGKVAVVTQRNAYHGDTLACMNAAERSIFNGPAQFPWNEERCVAVQPAYLRQSGGVWSITLPDGREVATPFKSTQDLFDVDVREFFHGEDDCTEGGGGGGGLQGAYRESIRAELDGREDLGALLIEPVCQGAGGMKFIDPLWQRELVRYCRRRGMPVIYDEIFVGLYRFGYESTKDLLRIDPDIACYGKLLTGGTVPLGVTLATEDIFESFLDDGKANALLHGHSYTAHPIGCAAAVFAFEKYDALLKDDEGRRAYWDEDLVRQTSRLEGVRSSIALGTVLAIELEGEEGYAATERTGALAKALGKEGVYCRPLGNVLYFMCSPFTEKKECDDLLGILLGSISGLLR